MCLLSGIATLAGYLSRTVAGLTLFVWLAVTVATSMGYVTLSHEDRVFVDATLFPVAVGALAVAVAATVIRSGLTSSGRSARGRRWAPTDHTRSKSQPRRR